LLQLTLSCPFTSAALTHVLTLSLHDALPISWGNTQQPAFLNQALLIETKLSPDELLTKILHIETSMGRERKVRWASRIIDIDILFYGSEISLTKYLIITHTEIQNSMFVHTHLIVLLHVLIPTHTKQ